MPDARQTANDSTRWFIVSLAAGITVAICTALIFLLPYGWATAAILAFLIALVWVLFHNPRYWYRRAAAGLISVLLALPILETFRFQLQTEFLYVDWNTGTSLFLYAIIAALIAYLLFLDYQSNQNHIRNMVSALERAEETDDRSEQLKIIDSVSKTKRDKLAMQALQAESEFFAADTESLPPEEKRAIILRQIELREQNMLAQHRQRMAIIIIVAFWIVGVSAVVSYKLISAGP